MPKRKHSHTRKHFDDFVDGYVTAALWSSNDESDESGGEPLDSNYSRSDIAPSSMKAMKRDCAKFFKQNRSDLDEYAEHKEYDPSQGSVWDYAGHDFWLSANGHGAGFFDRFEVPKDLRDRLQDAARRKFHSDLFVGDDGKIHVSPER